MKKAINVRIFLFALCAFVAIGASAAVAQQAYNYFAPAKFLRGGFFYGPREGCPQCAMWHKAYDLEPSQNTATHAGIVKTGYLSGYGNVVTVTDENFRTFYAHAGKLDTSLNGKTVQAGTRLGDWTTCTGICRPVQGAACLGTPEKPCSTGQNVHYETHVLENGRWVNVDPGVMRRLLVPSAAPKR